MNGQRSIIRRMDRRQVQQIVLFMLILVLLALRHLALYYSVTEFPHFPQLVDAFKHLDSVNPWVQGAPMWETRLHPGGPLFFWLSYPARVFDDPVIGIHLYYFLLELSVIGLWLLWGPRTGLTTELSWAGGFFLAVAFNSKFIVCENMTMAVYLAAVLFLALVWAMGKDSCKPMALVGLLLGVTVQVHVSTLVLALPLVLVVLLDKRLRASRLLVLGAAWLLVVLISFKGVYTLDEQHRSYAMTQLLTRFSWGNVPSRLFLSWQFPLSLLGLGLGIYTWYKDGARSAGLRLTILWLAIPYVLLSVMLAYMGGYAPHEPRYAMLNPARALLAGMGLTWLVARANPWLRRRFHREVDLLDVLIGAGLVLALVGALDARRHWEAFEARHAARASRTCNCDFWQYRDLSRHFQKFYAAVSRRGLPPQLAGKIVLASSPNREETEALIYWMRGRQGDPRKTAASYLLVTPKLDSFDLSRVEGAKDYGSFFMIPDCLPATVKELSRGRFSVTPAPGARRDRPLFVTVLGRNEFVVPKRLGLEVDGQLNAPTSGCHCHDPTDFYSYGGWMVYEAGAGGDASVVVDFASGEVDKVQVFTLPPLVQ